MAFKSILLVCFFFCCQISRVMAASECTPAILASVFGTIGAILLIAAIAALVWYCCRKRSGTLSSGSSVESASEPEFSLGAKSKGGDIGLNGHGTPVTFSHRYSEEAPSAAYNTKGVVNPAFGGSREVLIDMPSRHDGEVKLDMDGSPSIRPLSHKGDVKIDMDGDAGLKLPDGKRDVDFHHDHLDMSLTDGDHPDLSLPGRKLSGPDLPGGKLSGGGFSGGRLPGADADVHIEGPSSPKFNLEGPKNMQTVDVELDRPEQGGLGLLIAKDKSMPVPALFVREVTPGGIAAKTGLIDTGDKIIGINGVPIEGMPHDRAMGLLRESDKPKLQLKLLKNALYRGKDADASLDLPGGSIEKSCKIDVEPSLEAGVPSVDIEGMQGDAPDLGGVGISARKPGFEMSGPQVDMPEGKLKTQVSGPNVSSDFDVNGPSADLNLPSAKTKRGKCFSCASSGKKDEPYMRRKQTVDVELDRPKHGGMGLMIARDKALPPPALFVTDVTPGGIAAKTGKIDTGDKIVEINGVPIEGMSHDSAMSLLRDEDKPKLNLKLLKNGYSQDLAGGSLKAGTPSAELNMPNKKKRGNCFSCAGGADKDEPYKRRKGHADFEMKTGGQFDLSGADTDFGGDVGRGNAGYEFNGPEVGIDAPDINAPEGRMKTGISGPDVSLPSGEMKRAGKFDMSGSGPDFEGSGINKDIGLRGTGPDFDVHGANKGVASVDLPEGSRSVEKSCKIDVEPSLKAGVPSVDVDGMQGDADFEDIDISARKPGFDMSGPQVDMPKGKLKTQVSGPNVSSDFNGPSADLNLPSAKTKSGKCFSCASSGKKEEPYMKGKRTVDVELDRPKHGGMGLVMTRDKSLPPPALFVTDVTPGGIADKTGLIDAGDKIIGINGVPIEGMSHDNAMSLLRNDDKPKLQLKLLKNARYIVKGNSPDLPGGSLEAGSPSAELKMPKKKTRGNCFSCAGGADKEEPYKGRRGNADFEVKTGGKFDLSGTDTDFGGDVGRGNAGYEFNGPEVGIDVPEPGMTVKGRGPQEDLNLRAAAPDIEGDVALPHPSTSLPSARGARADRPDLDIDTGKPGVGIDANAPDFNKRGKLQMSGPDVDVPSGNVRGPNANIRGPSADVNLPSKKKPRGKCFSCAGGADKDEPYGRGSGNAKFDFDGPEADRSLGMPKAAIGKPTADIGGRATGPDFDLDTPDMDVSSKKPKFGLTSPELDAPKAGGSGEIGISGPGVSYGKPKLSGPSLGKPDKDFDIRRPDIDIDTPGIGGRATGPDFDLNTPDMDVSSKKPKFGLKSPELDAPKAGGSGEIGISGPGVSYGKPKLSGPSLGKPDKDFDIRRPDIDIDTPGVDASANKPDIKFGSPEFDASRPGGSVTIGTDGLDANAPDFDANKGKVQADLSGPDVRVPSGNVKRPKANIQSPSADLDISSKKKPRGNCFSCAGGADKDEPYRRGKGNAQFDFDGPDAGGSLEMSRPGIGKPNADIGGRASGSDFDLDTPEVDVSSRKPKFGLKSPELDAPKAGGSGEIDINGPGVSYGKPKLSGPSLGKPDKDFDIRRPDIDIDTPDVDVSANKPNIGFGSPEFDASRPGGSVKIGTDGLDANAPDFHTSKGKLKADLSRPDVDVRSGHLRGPNANVDGPTADLNLPSKKKSRGNCLSCAGGAEKDEPYIKGPGKPKFDLDAPDIDGSLDVKTPSTSMPDAGGRVTGPDFDMNAPDVDLSSKKPKIGLNAPELAKPDVKGSGEIDINGPEFSFGKPKASGPSFNIGKPDLDIKTPDVDVATKKPNIGFNVPNADIDGNISGPDFDMDTPGADISSKRPKFGFKAPELDTPNVGGSGDIDINGPEFSYGKPKISGPSFNIGKPDLDIKTPDVDVATKKPNIGFNVPNADIDRNISGPDFDMDTPDADISSKRPKFGFKAPELDTPNVGGSGDIDINGPEISYGKPKASGPSFNIGKPDLDIKTPDVDVATKKPNIGFNVPNADIGGKMAGPDFDMDTPDADISSEKPKFGFKVPDMDTPNFRGSGDIDVNGPEFSHGKPKFSGPSFGNPDTDIDIGTPDFGVNIPDVDAATKGPKIGFDSPEFGVPKTKGTGEMDLDGPDFSYDKPKISGPSVDADFDWGINTSTPKVNKQLKGFSPGDIELETTPVEGDISVVNTYDNFELQSTPQSFPSAAYDKPHSLQRYDEIRPEMELRLLSPKDSDQSDQKFNFEIPAASPGSMTLVKVEENVTVCSASVDEAEPPSPSNRKLTLNREISQKIEILFPTQEESDQPSKLKHSTTSSSSSSSSSDAEGDKEKKPKGKKKSRLFKAFRKSSSSSASSKDGKSKSKRKEKERKLSTSSSSSDDEEVEKKKRPSKEDALPVKTIEEIKVRKSSSSSSSDEAPSVGQRKDFPKRKSSTSSSSSSDKESHKDGKQIFPKVEHRTYPFTIGEINKPEEPAPGINTIQGDVPLVVSHSVKPVDPELSFVVEKPEEEIKIKERKSSTSSSSDEETKSPAVYKVDYSTHPQQYIIEPDGKPNLSFIPREDVQEDAPEVVLHSVKPSGPDFSFTSDTLTKPKERKSSTSSSSSSDEEGPKHEKDLGSQAVEFTILPQKRIGSYDIKPLDEQIAPERKGSTSSSSSDEEKEVTKRKSSTSSSSSEENVDLSNTLDVTVQRYETVHHVVTPDYPSTEHETESVDMQEKPFVVVSRSIKRPDIWTTASEEQDEPHVVVSSTEVQMSRPPTDVSYHLEYPWSPASVKEDKDAHVQEEGIVPVFKSKSVDFDVLQDLPEEDKVDEKDSRKSPTWDIQTHTFETVYHVTIPDNPARDENSQEIQEFSPPVVYRSVKKTTPLITSEDDDLEEEPQFFTTSTEVQFSEPSYDFQLEYPENDRFSFTHDGDVPSTEEEWIKRHTFEKESPDIAALLASFHHQDDEPQQRSDSRIKSEEEEETSPSPNDTKRRGSNSRIWDLMQGYLIEKPVLDDGESNTESKPQTNVAFERAEEPMVEIAKPVPKVESSTFELDPQTTEIVFEQTHPSKLVTYQIHLDDREPSKEVTTSISKVESSVEEVTPKASKYDPVTIQMDVGAKKSVPKESFTSSWRKDDSGLADVERVPQLYSSVDEVTPKASKFDPITFQMGVGAKKPVPKESVTASWRNEDSGLVDVERAQQHSSVEKVTPKASKFDPIAIQMDVGAKQPVPKDSVPASWRKEGSGLTDVEKYPQQHSRVEKITPKASKFDPVTFEMDFGAKKPVPKESSTASWTKEDSGRSLVDVDDNEDPWMRHYSRGLQRGTSYQPTSTRSPERDTSFTQSRSLSLSKVPHVRSIKTSAEKERGRPRYSIEGRTTTEPTAYRASSDRRAMLRELEAVPRVRTTESVFSTRDGKNQPSKSQTRTTSEESSRERSDILPSVRNLRALWDK